MTIKDTATLGELRQSHSVWLTVTELAKELNVHPDTIRRWANKGRLKCKRHPINNYRLFLVSDVWGEKEE